MAVLSDNVRASVWRGLMRYFSRERSATGAMTKDDLRAAVNALDNFLDTNATAINNAIPQPARAELSSGQKALLLSAVALARYAPELARALLGSED